MADRPSPKRRGRALVGVLILSVVLFTFFTNRWFVSPSTTADLQPVDVLVVFPGGPKAEDRFELARELMESGIADEMFVSTDVRQSTLEAQVCSGAWDGVVSSCRLSDPVNTFGNARIFALEAEARGWESMILVTSTQHMTRSATLLARCFSGEVQYAASEPTWSRLRHARAVAHEWGGMVKALFSDRDCS